MFQDFAATLFAMTNGKKEGKKGVFINKGLFE